MSKSLKKVQQFVGHKPRKRPGKAGNHRNPPVKDSGRGKNARNG